jgi:DNA-binding response OmpR family regulator
MAKILIVEDERSLSSLVKSDLEEDGHRVTQVFNGVSALEAATEMSPDLIILDIMLPKMDGLEVCRRLRQQSIVPILMLTARAEELDRVLGLELGADDYLTKPFSMHELRARVHAILRRLEMSRPTNVGGHPAIVEIAGLRLDLEGHEASLNGTPLDLTPKEFTLIHLLATHPGRVFSREYLLDEIWGYDSAGYDRTVDTHIYRVRQKLGKNSEVSERIVAVRGLGYKFKRE